MADLYKVSELVKDVLETNPLARNNDNFLYYLVLKKVGKKNGIDIDGMSMPMFLLHMREYGFPPFESVRRSRQKIQHDCQELAGMREIEKWRQIEEEKYRAFALDDLEKENITHGKEATY